MNMKSPRPTLLLCFLIALAAFVFILSGCQKHSFDFARSTKSEDQPAYTVAVDPNRSPAEKHAE